MRRHRVGQHGQGARADRDGTDSAGAAERSVELRQPDERRGVRGECDATEGAAADGGGGGAAGGSEPRVQSRG